MKKPNFSTYYLSFSNEDYGRQDPLRLGFLGCSIWGKGNLQSLFPVKYSTLGLNGPHLAY